MIGSQSIGQNIEIVQNTNPSMSLDDSIEDPDYNKRVK